MKHTIAYGRRYKMQKYVAPGSTSLRLFFLEEIKKIAGGERLRRGGRSGESGLALNNIKP